LTTYVRRFALTLLFGLILVVTGVVGYGLIEGWGTLDALYMTAITLSAVGYSEVRPLSRAGRTFTMFLLLGGLTWMGFWFANLTSVIVELDLKDVLRRRRTMNAIAQLQDHVIICGGGRTGRQVAQELRTMTDRFVIIEREPAQVEELTEYLPGARVMEGDATHDNVLIDAGVDRATGLVACLSADTDNLFVCLSARDLAPELTIVARAYEEETMYKLYRAGADHVVSPNVSSAIRMASVIMRPSVVSFLDIATRSSDLNLRLEQASISERSTLAGKTLAEASIPQRTGLIIIAVRKMLDEEPEFVFNPVADTRLEAGDEMIVLGKDEQIEKLKEYVTA